MVFVAFLLLPLTHSLLLVLMTPLTYTLSSLSVTIGCGVLFTRTIYTLQHYYLAQGRSGTVLQLALSSYVVSIAHYNRPFIVKALHAMPQPTTHDRHMITPYTLLSPTDSLITVPVTLAVVFCMHIYSPLYERFHYLVPGRREDGNTVGV